MGRTEARGVCIVQWEPCTLHAGDGARATAGGGVWRLPAGGHTGSHKCCLTSSVHSRRAADASTYVCIAFVPRRGARGVCAPPARGTCVRTYVARPGRWGGIMGAHRASQMRCADAAIPRRRGHMAGYVRVRASGCARRHARPTSLPRARILGASCVL